MGALEKKILIFGLLAIIVLFEIALVAVYSKKQSSKPLIDPNRIPPSTEYFLNPDSGAFGYYDYLGLLNTGEPLPELTEDICRANNRQKAITLDTGTTFFSETDACLAILKTASDMHEEKRKVKNREPGEGNFRKLLLYDAAFFKIRKFGYWDYLREQQDPLITKRPLSRQVCFDSEKIGFCPSDTQKICNERTMCFQKLQVTEPDPEICIYISSSIHNPQDREGVYIECLKDVAITLKDPGICHNLGEDPEDWYWRCYAEAIQKDGAIDDCLKISDTKTRHSCYEALASKEWWDKILGPDAPSMRATKVSYEIIRQKKITQCSRMNFFINQERCYREQVDFQDYVDQGFIECGIMDIRCKASKTSPKKTCVLSRDLDTWKPCLYAQAINLISYPNPSQPEYAAFKQRYSSFLRDLKSQKGEKQEFFCKALMPVTDKTYVEITEGDYAAVRDQYCGGFEYLKDPNWPWHKLDEENAKTINYYATTGLP